MIRGTLIGISIVVAGGVAWWVQRPASTAASLQTPDAPQRQGANAAAASGKKGGGALAPAPIEVVNARTIPLLNQTQAVGSLQSRRSVIIRPEVSGRITQLNFQDGQPVHRGQSLVQLDDQLPQAQVQQSQAERSIAQANHQRNQELVSKGFISQRSLDESAAALAVAQAKLALSQATAARLRIQAPFDGVVGIRTVHAGEYVKDGTDIVNIEDLSAMLLNYRLPERLQPQVRVGQVVSVTLDALPSEPYAAVVRAINPQIDAQGRSIAIQACISNAQGTLRPGMFARVTASLGDTRQAVVVPEQAIVADANGVHVIKVVAAADKKSQASQKTPVELGWRGHGLVEVTRGLESGDTIVTAGQQRIRRDGSTVNIVKTTELALPTQQAPDASTPSQLPAQASKTVAQQAITNKNKTNNACAPMAR